VGVNSSKSPPVTSSGSTYNERLPIENVPLTQTIYKCRLGRDFAEKPPFTSPSPLRLYEQLEPAK